MLKFGQSPVPIYFPESQVISFPSIASGEFSNNRQQIFSGHGVRPDRVKDGSSGREDGQRYWKGCIDARCRVMLVKTRAREEGRLGEGGCHRFSFNVMSGKLASRDYFVPKMGK